MQVDIVHRIVGTIRIRTDAVVFLAEGIDAVPSCEDGVVLAGTVVVGVQAKRAVELLTVVLVLLEVAVPYHRLQRVHELAAEGVVVHALLHRARRGHRLTHRAQMVLVLVVERELVRRAAGRRLGVAAVEEVLVDLAVPHHQAAAQQVVRRVRALDLRRLQLHLLPDRTGDVRLGRVVHHAQLLARRTVDVLRDAAVGEVDLLGIAAQVVDIAIAYHLPSHMVDSEGKYRQFV